MSLVTFQSTPHSRSQQHLVAVVDPEVDGVGVGLDVAAQRGLLTDHGAEQLWHGLDLGPDCGNGDTSRNDSGVTEQLWRHGTAMGWS